MVKHIFTLLIFAAEILIVSQSNSASTMDGNVITAVENIQPDIQLCLRLSSAQEQNDQITQWYIDQFFENPSNQRIIELRRSVVLDGRPIISPTGADGQPIIGGFNALPAHIKDAFTTIASDRVGRILLFRLLIEIHKKGRAKALKQRQITFSPVDLVANTCYSSGDCTIRVPYTALPMNGNGTYTADTTPYFTPVVDDSRRDVAWTVRLEAETPFAIVLFHEMLHWFHNLFDEDRYTRERNGLAGYGAFGESISEPIPIGPNETFSAYVASSSRLFKPLTPSHVPGLFLPGLITEHVDSRFYVYFVQQVVFLPVDRSNPQSIPLHDPEIADIVRQNPGIDCVSMWMDLDGKIPYEDVRTILGSIEYESCPGDELSENAFRKSLRVPIRVGYYFLPTGGRQLLSEVQIETARRSFYHAVDSTKWMN
jgi:hypothetical protein